MQNKLIISGLMYDNIRLSMPYPFEHEHERNAFCIRFGLFVKDEKKGIFHNKGYETLEQNKGLYIRMETPTAKRTGNISISLSLHKFYNQTVNGQYFNFDDFNFENADKAYKALTDLMPFDIGRATVKAFEVGINVVTPESPDDFMKELNGIHIKGREMRIIEDSHYKEYKQFSTHKDRDKRIIYIFYNKTFEARSKTKDTAKREAVPDNILRIEKDTHRPNEKILFGQLFDPVQQKAIKNEFEQRFVNDLKYNSTPIKPKELTDYQFRFWEKLQTKSEKQLKEQQKDLYKSTEITQRQYYFSIKTINEVISKNIEPKRINSTKGELLKQLIISKLNEIEKVT